MDEMVIQSDFIKNVLAKLILKMMKAKFGVSPTIIFKEPIRIQKDEEFADLDLDIHVSMSVEDLSKLLKDLI